jgi:exodeoxyribonuclease-5
MCWSPQQAAALDDVAGWLQTDSKPIFYVAGYAGTGKTMLACHLAKQAAGKVLYAAFTGKAASIMRSKGCAGATTIHSLIYKPKDKSGETLRFLETKLDRLEAETPPDLAKIENTKRLVEAEKRRVRQPAFLLNPDSELRGAALLVIDECSMVGQEMGQHLLSFDVPILVLGDPAQLPPVASAGYFTRRTPDVMLTEIHRQAGDNPIIDMATRVREGRGLPYGAYGESRVLRQSEFDRDEAIQSGAQILVGRNETRRRANSRVRESRGFTDIYPVSGDRLVCLRNDHDIGLLNGTIWTVTKTLGGGDQTRYLQVRSEDDVEIVVEAHAAPFLGEEVPVHEIRDAQMFDWGYCLTVHRAQGSQWDEVVLIDESSCFREHADKWRYTGITRASKRVTVVR